MSTSYLWDEIVFVEVDDVFRVHREGIRLFGGSNGLRDPGLLNSAVMAPKSGRYGTLAELAAAYLYGIVKNHPFIDGNKRAALGAAVAFLGVNLRIDLALGREWSGHVLGVAAGEVSRERLVQLFIEAMGGDPGVIRDEGSK